ncbi:MAG: type II toxin-antitoxin system VapC family toxin [Bryobacterales bacterium]|nr:type II toxin-antitoxin system VapC family toxin [Bryobacterales bacterium]
MIGFLLDTNVVSELVKSRPEPRVAGWIERADEGRLFLSVLTLGEIRKGIALLSDAARRGTLERWLETGLRARFAGRVLPIDEAVADTWGVVAAAAARAGTPVPAIDGLLAATALCYNLTLVTRNTADVAGTGVRVLNPWA